MKRFFLKTTWVGLIAFCSLQARATSITSIDVGIVGAAFSPGGSFTMAGGTGITVHYESDPDASAFGAIFTLTTAGMSSSLSGGGLTIDYTGLGAISLVSSLGNLSADLVSLSMTLTGGGGFQGVGAFNVTSDTMTGGFGPVGGIANFGFSFNGVATSWTSPFGGIATAILSAPPPGTPGTSVPDNGTTLSLLGMGLLSIGAAYRRFVRR